MAEYDAHSKASTEAYREGYDRIFRKHDNREDCPLAEVCEPKQCATGVCPAVEALKRTPK